MGHALYRKYRSKTLDEVVGQEHITTTLKNALKTKTFSHAYLFTGPKGVGKTSIARILAHEVNNLPYNEETTHLDIIEIDAASNRRIDEIRDLRDKVHIAPSSAKYKVYIIDEVHMLTKEAFNALLKTLEEPPAHVIFILATTELSKLPETIISRTQHFTFKPIAREDTINHLSAIAKKEGIELETEAAALIADNSGGSFRDSISLLDKLKTGSSVINQSHVRQGLGIAPDSVIADILEQVQIGTPESLATQLEELKYHGYSASTLARQLAGMLRASYIKTGNEDYLIIYKQLTEVAGTLDSETLLEVILFEAQARQKKPMSEVATSKLNLSTDEMPTTEEADTKAKTKKHTLSDEAPEKTPEQAPSVDTDSDAWSAILSEIKKHHTTLYSVLRMSKAAVTDNEIILSFKFPFHFKQINDPQKINKITEISAATTGIQRVVRCVQDQSETPTKPATNENLLTINNIFGPSEVLES